MYAVSLLSYEQDDYPHSFFYIPYTTDENCIAQVLLDRCSYVLLC